MLTVPKVEELWDSMCTAAISVTSKALGEVTNAEVLLKIKLVIALFIQTMEGWGYSVSRLDDFLLDMFDKYAELLKKRFSEDFQEVSVDLVVCDLRRSCLQLLDCFYGRLHAYGHQLKEGL